MPVILSRLHRCWSLVVAGRLEMITTPFTGGVPAFLQECLTGSDASARRSAEQGRCFPVKSPSPRSPGTLSECGAQAAVSR